MAKRMTLSQRSSAGGHLHFFRNPKRPPPLSTACFAFCLPFWVVFLAALEICVASSESINRRRGIAHATLSTPILFLNAARFYIHIIALTMSMQGLGVEWRIHNQWVSPDSMGTLEGLTQGGLHLAKNSQSSSSVCHVASGGMSLRYASVGFRMTHPLCALRGSSRCLSSVVVYRLLVPRVIT